ncbi:MAG: carboxypeptidase regulatory-like domain-containing protein [bacterium]|nr:carboxypeptidase regulatory-like domain-containing protein [bacterium]
MRTATLAKSSRGYARYAVDDLEDGVFVIEVRAPGYVPWKRTGVRPGERLQARLQGQAAATIEVTDRLTGERVLDYQLDLRFDDASVHDRVHRLRELSSAHPANGRYEHLPPVAVTLIVSAEGYAPLELSAGELDAGRVVHLRGELSRGATVRGVVHDGRGFPAEGARVSLFPHRKGWSPYSPLFSHSMSSAERGSFDARSRKTESDASGRFQLTDVSDGKFDLAAVHGQIACVEQVSVAAGGRIAVELELPGTGAISGRIVAPAGVNFSGIDLVVRPAGISYVALEGMHSQDLETEWLVAVPVAQDGSYRVEPLVAGEVTIYSMMPSSDVPNRSCSFVEQRTVVVEQGVCTKIDLDWISDFPGKIELEVLVNGELAPGLVVEIDQRGERGVRRSHGGRLNGESRLELHPVFVGDWTLRIRPRSKAWAYEHHDLVRVPSGEAVVLKIDIRN